LNCIFYRFHKYISQQWNGGSSP